MSIASMPHIKWTGTLQTTGPSTPPAYDAVGTVNLNGADDDQIGRFPASSNIDAGDLLIVALASYGGGAADGAKTMQSGDDWNKLFDAEDGGTDNARLTVWWRYAKARDKGGVSIFATDANTFAAQAIVISGVASSSPITYSTTTTNGAALHPTTDLAVSKNSLSLFIANIFDSSVGSSSDPAGTTAIANNTGVTSGLDRCVLRTCYKTNSADGTSGVLNFGSSSGENSIVANLTIAGGFRSTFLAHSVDTEWANVIYAFEPNYEDLVTNEQVVDISGNAPTLVIDTASNNLNNYISRQNGASIRGNGSRWYKGDNTNGEFTIPTGEFCIEWWYRVAATNQSNAIWGLYNVTGNHRSYYFYTNVGQLGFYFSKNGTDFFGPLITTTQPTANAWHHVCVERNSSDLIRLYLDGVVVDSMTDGDAWNNPAGNADFMIGGRNNGGQLMSSDVYVGAIRATAAARYDGAFTVPDDVWPRGS